jgi:Ca2+/H+ antiporter
VVWHVVVVVTGYEIGYVAIGVGWLIGLTVHIGSGRKRAAPLQALSAGITLLTLVVANYFTFLHFLRAYLIEQKTEGYGGQFFFVSPLEPSFLQSLISPIGLLIWAIALYVAFSVPKPRAL